MPRFRKHVFVCINERKPDDARGCCHSKGSLELLDYLKGRIHELGLKAKVRINKAGCLDACAEGPALVIYPDDVWYSPKTTTDIEEIITEHIQNDRPVNKLTIPYQQ